jgi:urease accessory protein
MSSDWLTWQLADSAFPTGLFAHSWGLESAWQQGEIPDGEALRRFVGEAVLQTAHAAMPLVNEAYASPDRLEALDAVADAFLTNVVANRASRIQGRTLAATAARVWPSPDLAALDARARHSCAHVAPVTGATFRMLGIPVETAQHMMLFGTARGVISAAVRLGIVGSYEAQRLQHACAPVLDEAARQCAALTVADLAQPAPVLDLLQAAHDRLYSRLFQS